MNTHVAITHLVLRYAELIDAGDLEGVADLFARAELTAEGEATVRRGRDEVLANYRAWTRLHDDGTPRTKHVTTNLIIEVADDGATATCRSYFTVLQAVPGELALQPVIAGRYHDRFALDPDEGWHLTARHITVDLVGDLSAHLRHDLG